ncbi:hypothetical protein [Mesorhizobium sp. WSM2239]
MAFVVCALGVAAIYFVVYRISKRLGMSNNTTVLVDTTYESFKERRFKVPVRQITIGSFRNVLYGCAILAILMGCMLLVFLVILILQQTGAA